MKDRRRTLIWHRAGPIAALATLALAGAASQGCGGGGSGNTGTGGSSSSSGTMSTSSGTMMTSSSSGTMSSSSGTGGSSAFMGDATPVADALAALDAVPDPTGTTIYFTAFDPTNGPGVFKVPADGSNLTPTAVQVGAPFAAPFGITTSTDGKQLYVADPGATDAVSNQDLGVIFSLPVGGGTPTILSGTELSEARALEVRQESGADVLYFTGRNKANGSVGVYKIPASGGTISTVAEGAPFIDPSGIALAADGTIYVADTIGSATRTANIIKISNGTASAFLSDLRVGYPCGLALTQGDTDLVISSLDPATLTDVILQVEIATMTQTPLVPMSIKGNTEAAGIHRAKGANVFAWADSSAGPAGGRVFSIK